MKFWNISAKTPSDPGVAVTIAGQVAKPGESVDVPAHFVAEASHLMAQGLITNERPAPTPVVQPPEEPAAPAAEPSETDDSQPREGSRRRRQ